MTSLKRNKVQFLTTKLPYTILENVPSLTNLLEASTSFSGYIIIVVVSVSVLEREKMMPLLVVVALYVGSGRGREGKYQDSLPACLCFR